MDLPRVAALAGLSIAISIGAMPASRAAEPGDAFIGTWVGKGNRADLGAGVNGPSEEIRDLHLTISRRPDGTFAVSSLMARGGADPFGAPTFRSNTLNYKLEGGSSWAAQDECRDVAEAPCAWAELEGNVLVTFIIARRDDGTLEVQSARRTIIPGGMAVSYTRLISGRVDVKIEGRLVRVSP
jgi:hypothetical protein